MKTLIALFITSLLFAAPPVFAIDLQTAKDQGLVGETTRGYIEAVRKPSAEVKALVEDINSRRKQKFKDIAKQRNTSLEAVEQLAGKKAIEKSKPGSWVKIGGSWQQK